MFVLHGISVRVKIGDCLSKVMIRIGPLTLILPGIMATGGGMKPL